jgi:SAM-dependent methyltransferase
MQVGNRGAERDNSVWPSGFERFLDEDWTKQDVHDIGRAYDDVEGHGWYSNLDPLVDQLAADLGDGDVLLDYSGGTGILVDRLRARIGDRAVGVLIADAGARFLRVALEKYRGDEMVGMRLLRYLKDEKRLQALDEVLGPEMLERGVDAIAVANAIHLYPNLDEVVASWNRTLRPGGKLYVCSGNLLDPRAAPDSWIIDRTVGVIGEVAATIVRSDERYERYRSVLDDSERMQAYDAVRDRVFLEPRPIADYTNAFEAVGLIVTETREQTIVADVDEWTDFLAAYHEAVLGWVGGTRKVDGVDATSEAVDDRLTLMRRAMKQIFEGRQTFDATWTYLTCQKPLA